jgi:hypothetical protein
MADPLRDEIINDPLGRGYSGMTDDQIVASLNTVDRPRQRDSVPTPEIFEAIVASEYDSLSAAAKARVNILLGLPHVDPNGDNTVATLMAFPAGSATRAALMALREQNISRAQELGLGRIKPGYVAAARSA